MGEYNWIDKTLWKNLLGEIAVLQAGYQKART